MQILDKVQDKLNEAKKQAQKYGQVLEKKYGWALRLRKYAVVALGFDRLVWASWPSEKQTTEEGKAIIDTEKEDKKDHNQPES